MEFLFEAADLFAVARGQEPGPYQPDERQETRQPAADSERTGENGP